MKFYRSNGIGSNEDILRSCERKKLHHEDGFLEEASYGTICLGLHNAFASKPLSL